MALSDVDASIQQQIRYATPHNFTGARVDGYDAPECLLTAPAARALHRAQVTLRRQGYSLKVYDCYRPQRAVNRFVAWAKDLRATSMKGEFYPRVDKTRLFADGYIAERSGHSRGSTVDLTIVRLPAAPERAYRPGEHLTPCYAPRAQRFPDDSVDMGTGFDCFDTLAHTTDPRVHGAQRAARALLANTLRRSRIHRSPRGMVALHVRGGTLSAHLFRLPRLTAVTGSLTFRLPRQCPSRNPPPGTTFSTRRTRPLRCTDTAVTPRDHRTGGDVSTKRGEPPE